MAMAQYEMTIHDYFRIIRKRKWIIILTTLTVYMAAIVYTKMQKKIYEVASRIEIVEKSQVGKDYVGVSNVELTSGNTINTAIKILTSRNLIIRVIADLKLIDANAPSSVVQRVISDIQNRIEVKQEPQSNVVMIKLVSTDAVTATQIVNKIAEVFISESLKYIQHEKNVLRDFLAEQVEKSRIKLEQAEEDLLRFKEESSGSKLLGKWSISEDAIISIQNEINTLAEERKKKEEILEILRKKILGKEVDIFLVPEISSDDKLHKYQQQIEQNKAEIEKLLERYTESHPKIYIYNQKIKEIKSKVDEYVKEKLNPIINKYEEQIAESWAKENELKKEKEFIAARLRNLPREQLLGMKLEKAVQVATQMYNMYKDKYEQLRIQEASAAPIARIVDLAGVPRYPIYPNERQNALAGLVIGLILGFTFAFIIESMDTSIGTIEDVEKYTQKPVLAVIPHIRIDAEKIRKFKQRVESSGEVFNERQAKLVAISDPKSPVTEAYRTLRTNLQFAFKTDKKCKKILFSSATPQEGKSTTLTNLAVIMAQAGKKTLIMSCNLRHPSCYKTFGIKKKPGITDILSGGLNWRDVIQSPGIDNLKILSAGPYPPNPSELLSSKEFDDLLKELEEEFEIILFDSPPILPVTDAAVIASKCDAVVLVYFVGKAAREALLRAKIQLENVGANIIGIVLNDIKAEGKLAYTYYYHYQYKYYGVRDAKESAV